jgi:hypothetical protein
VTGLAITELLRASHIKPWAARDTDAERLDVFNGLLLAPHCDALFARGFITFGTTEPACFGRPEQHPPGGHAGTDAELKDEV